MGKAKQAHKRIKQRSYSVPSPSEVESAKTPAGAWTAQQLASWGVAWPPPKGWRTYLEQRYLTVGPGQTTDQRVTKGMIENEGWSYRDAVTNSKVRRIERGKEKRLECDQPGCVRTPAPVKLTDGANTDGTLRSLSFCGPVCLGQWEARNPFNPRSRTMPERAPQRDETHDWHVGDMHRPIGHIQ